MKMSAHVVGVALAGAASLTTPANNSYTHLARSPAQWVPRSGIVCGTLAPSLGFAQEIDNEVRLMRGHLDSLLASARYRDESRGERWADTPPLPEEEVTTYIAISFTEPEEPLMPADPRDSLRDA